MRLVVGLGNPGARYMLTRHNIGALALARAAEQWAIPWNQVVGARWGRGCRGSAEVILATPVAWMNESGSVVAALLDSHGVSPQDLVVVHDDLALDLGRLRLKRQGGTGGHKGVLSLLTALGTDQFCRLKIGIGSPGPGEDPTEYVLSPFPQDVLPRIDVLLERAVSALDCLLGEGVEAAMNRFNARTTME